MIKKEFMENLYNRLSTIDTNERNNIINYYDELIDDKVDSGTPVEEAIRELGSVDEIIIRLNFNIDNKKRNNIINKSDSTTNRNSKKMDREQKKILIIILICTFPFWIGILGGVFGILIAVICIIFSIFIAGISLTLSGLFGIIINIFGLGSLLSLGVSFLILGIGLLLIPPTILFGKWCLIESIKGIRYIEKKVKEL